jgi:hypothetical protein
MHKIKQIGYMPGYGLYDNRAFTKEFDKTVSINIDNVDVDDSSEFRVLLQSEPPNLWIRFAKMVQDNADKFDLILTYDDRLLELPNAKEFCAVGSWINDDLVLDKKNQISFLMSSKINGDAYHMRFRIMRKFEKLKENRINNFDINWYRSPPRLPSKDDFFRNAKFNIATENQIMTNMYTEKLLDCFKTYTVPIYYGCTNIEKYFNPKGIIRFNTFEELEHILDNLDPAMYDEMLPYLEENYNLAKPLWGKTIYQRIEDEIEKCMGLNLEQNDNLLHTIIFE